MLPFHRNMNKEKNTFPKKRTFRLLSNLQMRVLKQINAPFFLYFAVVSLCLLSISCQDKNKTDSAKSFQEERTLSFSEKLEVLDDQFVELLPQAKKETAKWLAYITAQSEINRFKTYTVQDAVNHATTVKKIMAELSETVPKTFQVKPVLSRISVLVTLSNVLKQSSNNPSSTAEEIAVTAEKIPVAFQNLKIQLNEVFRKGLEDFKLELEETDSIEKKELKKEKPLSTGTLLQLKPKRP